MGICTAVVNIHAAAYNIPTILGMVDSRYGQSRQQAHLNLTDHALARLQLWPVAVLRVVAMSHGRTSTMLVLLGVLSCFAKRDSFWRSARNTKPGKKYWCCEITTKPK